MIYWGGKNKKKTSEVNETKGFQQGWTNEIMSLTLVLGLKNAKCFQVKAFQ